MDLGKGDRGKCTRMSKPGDMERVRTLTKQGLSNDALSDSVLITEGAFEFAFFARSDLRNRVSIVGEFPHWAHSTRFEGT